MKPLLVLFIALCATPTLGRISNVFEYGVPLDDLMHDTLGKTFNGKIIDIIPIGEDLDTMILSTPFSTLSFEEIVINLLRFVTDKIEDKVSQLNPKIIDGLFTLLAKKLAIEYALYGLNDLGVFIEDGLAIFYFETLTEEEVWNGLPEGTIFQKRVRSDDHRNIVKPLYLKRFASIASGAGAGSLIGYCLTGLSSWTGGGALIGIYAGQWLYEYIFAEEIEEVYHKLGEDYLRGVDTKKPTKNPPGQEKARMKEKIENQAETIEKQQEEIERLRQELAGRREQIN